MLDITITAETKKLIDKLVHTENKDDIADIVKKFVPYATDFEVMRFANYRGYFDNYFTDEFMDIEKETDRIKFAEKNYYAEKYLKLVPYIPLTEDDRLYRLPCVESNAPEIENPFLKNFKISNQDWREMRPEGKYVIRAMRNNPELDFESAENFVIDEIKKAINSEKETAQKRKSEPETKMSDEEIFYFYCWTETHYMKRQNFFTKKLNPEMTDQEIIDSGYDHLLHFIKCEVDLNFNVRSSISVDYHFARLVEDFYNDENRQKYGDNFKAEFFGETFMRVLAEVV